MIRTPRRRSRPLPDGEPVRRAVSARPPATPPARPPATPPDRATAAPGADGAAPDRPEHRRSRA
ncbi:hypothetical protein HNR23_001927 [Nocardiopsis mwathae]|uniref:Uncharacterized protein n=1 Tax=Nocardiopsis mwathae TaxID=1472723 RepID=A0A7W9YGV7_9ACTN|nr:hypothetical protein [Nocardiopsis mwathae]MBB6171867.1 hypothetical protein [Nocardiopsis mwathae]